MSTLCTVIKTATAVLPGMSNIANTANIANMANMTNMTDTADILSTISMLPGASNGPAAVNFTDSHTNILPFLPGLSKVGVHVFSILDPDRHLNPLCDFGDTNSSHDLCHQPREMRVSMLYVRVPRPHQWSPVYCQSLTCYHEATRRVLHRQMGVSHLFC